ncbi:MAG: DJ-1/PfpI family protein [Actinomycetota bacterium]
MDVVIVLPDGVTVFEALGPWGVFARLDDTTVRMVGDRAGRVPGHGSKVPLVAETSYLFLDPTHVADVLVVPGGLGIRQLVHDRSMLDWLRTAHESARWTIGISTGSVLLSAAGLLTERDATTHWLARDLLEDEGAHAVPERVVRSDDIVTATGAVSGLEAALLVAAEERGREVVDHIRADLDDELTGRLSDNRPAGPDEMRQLTGLPARSPGAPFVDGPSEGPWWRRARGWSPRTGRLRVRGRSELAPTVG